VGKVKVGGDEEVRGEARMREGIGAGVGAGIVRGSGR